MRKLYFIALFFTFATASFSQLLVNFSDATATSPSEIVDIDVTVENWDTLISAQFSINWDPSVFNFSSIENVTTDLEEFTLGGNIGTPVSAQAVSEGQLTVSWSLSSTLPASIPNGTRLFTLRLEAVGSNGDETNLTISNIPRVTEVINVQKVDIGAIAGGGELRIDDGTGGNTDCVDLIIENVSAEAGSNICVPIVVNRFTDIASVQTGLTWNSSILRFTGVNEVGVSGVSTNDANADQGELRLLWLIGLGDQPVTLNDGTTIFEVCFDVIGNNGESTNIRFESLPNFDIEIANGDGISEDVCTDNGRLTISGMTQPQTGVGLIGGCVATNGSSSICLPVTTRNFDQIASIQSGITWDSDVISFTGINEGALTGITVNAANADQGELRMLWIIGLGEQPRDVADDGVLFELCFDVVGNNGDEASVTFASLPNFAVEIANGDGMSEEFFVEAGKVAIGDSGCDNGGGGGGEPQNGVGLIANDACSMGASNFCVPITTREFRSIASIQTGITWDASVISFTGINEAGLTGITVNQANADQGELRLLWIIGLGSDPVTLDDDAVLFELCFDALGTEGDQAIVGFMDLPNFAIEIANGNGMSEEFFISNGNAYVGVNCPEPNVPGDCPDGLGTDLAVYAGNVSAEEGDEICVPITVANFDNIQSMQFTLEWDETVAEYVRQDNFGLSDLGNANFNFIAPNKLRVSWTPLSPSGALDNCSTIFEVCFNAVGDCNNTPMTPISIISDGNVLIEITDGNNDVLDVDIFPGSISINECSADPRIDITEQTNVSCAGDMDGALVVEVTGTGEITCQWTNAAGDVVGDDCNLSGVGAGEYILTATNGDSMVNTRTVIITEPDSLMIDVSITDRTCDVESAFMVNVTGGTVNSGAYSYSYDAPVDLGDAAQHDAIPGGMYSVTVTDDNGCTAVQTFEVGDESIIVDAQVTGITNIDGSGGSISVSATGMMGGMITYEWEDGSTNPQRNNLAPGTYTVTVSDGDACSSVRVFEVDWEAIFVNNIVSESSERFNGFGISCPGDDNGMISGSIIGGCNDGPIVLTIDGDEVTLPITATEGTYTIVATDACGNTDMQTIEISPPDPIELAVRDGNQLQDECANFGAADGQVDLGPLLSGGVPAYTIQSSQGTVSDLLIEDLEIGSITITVEDANGCQALFEDVMVEECLSTGECDVISIISPNGDGKNDQFIVDCARRTPNKLGVYNRWGELVFEMDDYDNSWDGTHMDGTELDEGGYMWIMKISRPDEPQELFRGTVTLLRSN